MKIITEMRQVEIQFVKLHRGIRNLSGTRIREILVLFFPRIWFHSTVF